MSVGSCNRSLAEAAYHTFSTSQERAAQKIQEYLKGIPPVDPRWSIFQSLICLEKLEETYLNRPHHFRTEQQFVKQCKEASGFLHWGFDLNGDIYLAIKLQTDLFSNSFLLLDLPRRRNYYDDYPYVKAKILCENPTDTIKLTNDQIDNLLEQLTLKQKLIQMMNGKAYLVRSDDEIAPFKIHFEID